MFEEDEDDKIVFPIGTYQFKFNGLKEEENALNYLYERGFNNNQIKRYDLRYTINECKDKRWNNRIIIPSYNKFNELNFYTGRDITGFSKQKYLNCGSFERKAIIINENLISWDADILLCEGNFDAMSLVNAIPLMGKYLNDDYYLFDCLLKFSSADIIVFLDNDATEDCKAICRKLCNAGLGDRLKFVPTEELRLKLNKSKKINLKKLDPSKLYELYSVKGICWVLKSAIPFDCI